MVSHNFAASEFVSHNIPDIGCYGLERNSRVATLKSAWQIPLIRKNVDVQDNLLNKIQIKLCVLNLNKFTHFYKNVMSK